MLFFKYENVVSCTESWLSAYPKTSLVCESFFAKIHLLTELGICTTQKGEKSCKATRLLKINFGHNIPVLNRVKKLPPYS